MYFINLYRTCHNSSWNAYRCVMNVLWLCSQSESSPNRSCLLIWLKLNDWGNVLMGMCRRILTRSTGTAVGLQDLRYHNWGTRIGQFKLNLQGISGWPFPVSSSIYTSSCSNISNTNEVVWSLAQSQTSKTGVFSFAGCVSTTPLGVQQKHHQQDKMCFLWSGLKKGPLSFQFQCLVPSAWPYASCLLWEMSVAGSEGWRGHLATQGPHTGPVRGVCSGVTGEGAGALRQGGERMSLWLSLCAHHELSAPLPSLNSCLTTQPPTLSVCCAPLWT